MILLVLACSRATSEPAVQPPVDAPSAPSPPARPASWPDGVVPQTAPFTSTPEAVPHAVVDRLTVHGWTDAGLAWGLAHPGMGGASCDMWAQLELVSPSGQLAVKRFEHPEVEADECTGPAPETALAEVRESWLAEQGARLGGIGLGGSTLVVSGENLEPMMYEAKAGYSLVVAGQTLEREAAEFVWDWELVEVFWHPHGTMVAALVAGTGMGFEGSYTRYEVQVLPLPPDASVE